MDAAKLLRHFLGNVIGDVLIVAGDLNVDGSRHALIDDGIDQAAGLDECGDLSQVGRELLPHAIDVGEGATLVLLFELNLHERRVHGGVGGVSGGQVGVHSDVGDDHLEV